MTTKKPTIGLRKPTRPKVSIPDNAASFVGIAKEPDAPIQEPVKAVASIARPTNKKPTAKSVEKKLEQFSETVKANRGKRTVKESKGTTVVVRADGTEKRRVSIYLETNVYHQLKFNSMIEGTDMTRTIEGLVLEYLEGKISLKSA
jgi:Cft2 family RNA processing exonuclease